MFPTFYDKEYVFTDLINYRFNLPKKGEVIVFEAPDDAEKDYIKRIIGLPGDSVSIRDGSVYLNNQKLDESKYLDSSVKTYGEKFLRDGETVIIEPGEYFVLGDNRPESADSRQWGLVKRKKIIGRSLFVYWPINRMRKVVNPYLPN